MRENNWKKRALSLLLAVMMVLSVIPGNAMPVRAVDPDAKVADKSTMDSWKQFFDLENPTTQNAGMVWTDKSVFTEVPNSLKNLYERDSSSTTSITMDSKDEDNFLVALSVMASNKTITGYSTIPTDTMLILDVSGSMKNNGCDDDMVDAANAAIERLQEINNNNRVGVVLYSGNSSTGNSGTGTATVILPLGRYTTETVRNGKEIYLNFSNHTVSLNNRVYIDGTTNPPKADQTSKEVVGGTYIQNGIKQAMDELCKANPVVEDGKIQAGTVRMPILVLMSDGAPTAATASYMNPGTSHMGNGSGNHTNSAIGFVTQLSAAYAKAKVADYYGRAAMFYTLGLGMNGMSNTEKDVAEHVLNPGQYMHDTATDDYDQYWSTYNKLSANGTMRIAWQQPSGNGTERKTANVAKADIEITQDYVDEFFKAESSQNVTLEQALINAFGKIVDEIILQSRYIPTLVSSGLHDLDGYVSFVDHIGEHMEVTDVKGMVIGDHFFSGAAFCEYIVTGKGGTIENPSELGDEFIRSVKARLDISDTSTAQALIQQAYEHGQIAYTDHNNFSNYVGWYSDANGNFVGFWYDGIDTAKPANATHINKSYGYLGEADESHGVRDTDLMYATVRVRKEIATGDETLAWAIPSSLIPTLTYEVKLAGKTHGSNLESITVSGADAPISLIFEVALDEHIHDYNIHEVEGSVPGHDDHYDEQTNKYTFYSNDWASTPENSVNTYSYFEASKENERYYYISDSVIYTDEAGEDPYTGTAAPDSDVYYYHEYYVYSEADGTKRTMVRIAPSALAVAQKDEESGNWFVPKGTPYQLLTTRQRLKDDPKTDVNENFTGTMPYVVWPVIDPETNTQYHTAAVLGNNGLLTVTPATGLKITKTLAETVEGSENKFTFVLSGGGSDNATLVRPGANADGSDKTEPLTFTDGKAEFTISADETVYITGLEAGETYTVTEKGNPEYAVQTIKVGGEVKEAANITLEAGQMQTVDFVNAPKGYGNLYITKEVTPAEGHTVPASMLAEEFELTVTMEGLANQEFTVEHSGDNTLTKVTTDENGKFTVNLKHTETFEVFEIPENTQVTVTEELGADSNFQVTYRTRNLSGGEADDDNVVTIGKDVNSTVVVMNQYTPKSTTVDLDIAGTKTFNPEASTAAEFTFKVQRYTGSEWIDVDGKTATVSYSENEKGDKTFEIQDLLAGVTFTKPGEYAFQVLEVIPEDRVDGITYDRTLHTFTVTITDVDGQLTASVVTHDEALEADENGAFTVEPKFVNTYHTAPIYLDVFKTVENESDSPLAGLQGFVFELYNAKIEDGKWSIDGEAIDRETSDGVGEARFAWTVDGKNAGTHYYILKETVGTDAGWTYDGCEYHVTVVVEKEDDGDVTATTTVTDAEGKTVDRITFTNAYTPDVAELVLNAKKELTGRTLAANEFEFEIYKDGQTTNPVATGTNDKDGNIVFVHTSDEEGTHTLSFDKVGTYKYDVVEKRGNLGGVTYDTTIYDLVVEVTDNGGTLVADYYYEDATGKVVTFRNTYKTNSTSLTLGGKKTLNGRNLLAGEFTFELKEGETVLQSVKNAGYNAGGVFTFAPITYTQAGTYTYTISEVKGNLTGVAYDTTFYKVVVEVEDNGAGKLIAKIGGEEVTEKKDYNFANTFTPQEIKHTISGTKNLTGKDLEDGAYTFVLTDKDGKFIESVNNTGKNFSFKEMTFNKTGTYEYKVYEMVGSEAGMTYDETVYNVKIVVTYDQERGVFVKDVTVEGGNGQIVFNNAFVDSASVTIEGNKVLDGRDLTEGEFTFVLSNVDGEELETVTNNADGSFSFTALTFWSEGNYEYHVTEKKGEDTSVIYDETLYHVHITVAKNADGTALEASYTIGIPTQEETPNSITFTNVTREEAGVHLEVSKVLDNRTLTAGEFTFVLKGEDGKELHTATNDVHGKVVFPAVSFNKEGTYTFTITEQVGTDPYMAYDGKIVTATVVVTAPADGGPFQVSVTYADNNNIDDVATQFTNKPNHAEGSFSFKKVNEDDQPLKDIEFTLTHVDCGCGVTIDNIVAKSNEEGVVTFEKVPTGHQYMLTETAKPDAYKTAEPRHVTDIYGKFYIDGVEAAAGENMVEIVNVAVGHTELILKGTKYLMDGNTQVTAPNGAYQFGLYVEGEEEPIQIQTNIAAAEQAQAAEVYSEFIFDAIILDDEGTFNYLIKEIPGTDSDIIYDTQTTYNVAVTVAKNNEQDLVITEIKVNGEMVNPENGVYHLEDVITFTNRLRGEAQANLQATKDLTGKPLTEGAYTFYLKNEAGETIQTKTNAANGSITFDALTYGDAGTYEYTITEQAGNDPYTTYDSRVINVTVTVVAKDEAYAATVTYTDAENNVIEPKFTNVFSDRGHVSLELLKVNENQEYLPGAEFTLTHSENCCDAQIGDIVATSREDGKVILDHIPSGHSYTLSETKAPDHYTPVADMKVEVRFGKIYINGSEEALNAALTVTNYYDGKAGIRGHKTLEGRALREGEFTFQMYEADKDFAIIGAEPIQTVTNAADGSFYFQAIEYDAAGTYYYVVREAEGNLDNITYDKNFYRVTVKVENVDGELVPTITAIPAQTPAALNSANRGDTVFSEVLEFVNKYTPDAATVTLTGTKNLSGRTMQEGEFEFALLDAQDNVLQTVKNAANGTFSFNTLTYSETGTHVYTVREVIGEAKNVVYDTTAYTVTVVVTKDEETGVLSAETTINNGGKLEFNNVFQQSGALVLQGTKTMDGKTPAAGVFTFTLRDAKGNVVDEVKNAADGTFTFKELVFDEVADYVYIIKETQGDDRGIIYDSREYHVHVKVVLNEQTNKYEISYTVGSPVEDHNARATSQLHFANVSRDPAVVHLQASKNLTGRVLKDKEFTFVLKDAEGNTVETVKNDADGNVFFSALHLNKAGEYKYTISEIPGNDPYMVYDGETYEVTVTVTVPDQDGEYANGPYQATVTYEGGSAPVFVNRPKKDVPMSFSLLKVDEEGNPLTGVEFTLIHINCDNCDASIADRTAVSDEEGLVSFTDILSGHQYILRETGKLDNYKATADRHVTDVFGMVYIDGEPAVGAELIQIVNVAADHTEVILKGIKYLKDAEGNTITATNGAYKFELYANVDGAYKLIDTQTNMATAEGTELYSEFVFDAIPLTAVGTYEYLIKEVKGTNADVVYDSTEYQVVVTVEQNGDELEVTSVTANGGQTVSFTNKLRAPVTGDVAARKQMAQGTLRENAFIFYLKDEDGEILQTSRNDGEGNVSFDTLTFTKAGTYVYTVTEQAGTNPYVDYDAAVYTVTFEVTPSGEGYAVTRTITLNGESVENIVFTNSVVDRGFAMLELKKVNELDEPMEGVEFTLTHNCGESCTAEIEPIVAVSRTDGLVILSHIPSGHRYILSETGTPAHYTKAADMQVSVTFGKVTVDGKEIGETEAITVVNYYEGQSKIVGKKILEGRAQKAGEFTFALYAADAQFNTSGDAIQTVTNASDGSFAFDTIEYSAAGTYYYVVKEVKGHDDNIGYDATVYHVTVEVTADEQTGELKPVITSEKVLADTPSTLNSGNKGDVVQSGVLEFRNVYTPDPTYVTLSGTKTLEGKMLENGMFTFVLKDAQGQVLQSVKNSANGTFTFETLEFTKAGTFVYTVNEVKGDNLNVTYDETVYTVTIDVTQDKVTGELSAQITVNHGGKLAFANTYTPDKVTLKLEGIKTLIGKELEADEFSFELKDEDGNVLQTVKNAADGTFAFEALEYSQAGVYNYTVSEVKGSNDRIAYDETVYGVSVMVINENGVLTAAATIDNGGKLAFSNTYTKATPDDICVPIVIRKILVNKSDCIMTPAGFRFAMTDKQGNTEYAVSGITGAAGFMLNYSEEDVGKTFVYTVREIDTGIEDMEYSKMVYTVWVTVGLNEDTNELYATVSVNGAPMSPAVLTFINTYEPEVPEEPTEPEPTEPEPTEPEPTEPEPTEPEPTEPEPTEPGPTEPEPTEPEPTKPEPTEPEPTKPEPTKPTKPGNDDVPDTGDNSNMVLWALLAGFSAIALFMLKVFTKKGKYSA